VPKRNFTTQRASQKAHETFSDKQRARERVCARFRYPRESYETDAQQKPRPRARRAVAYTTRPTRNPKESASARAPPLDAKIASHEPSTAPVSQNTPAQRRADSPRRRAATHNPNETPSRKTHPKPPQTTTKTTTMASYSTIPKTDEAPLLQRDVKVNVKTVLAGAAAASFALGALAATAVSATVAAPTTSFMKPMYVFNKSLGTKTFEECEKGCPELSGKDFKKGQMTIPCITSFDMNHQLLAWLQGKTGGKEKGEKDFVWIGHRTESEGSDGKWVPKGCDNLQNSQARGDMVFRNGCAFAGNTKKTECSGSEFDRAKGCAVLVNALSDAGANSLNLPSGEITSYDQLHGNWVKSENCETAGDELDYKGPQKPTCICQKTQA